MAHVSIREYDAKKMRSAFSQSRYDGFVVKKTFSDDQLNSLLERDGHSSFVVKPDQLFGKRAQYDLVGINLDKHNTLAWLQEHKGKTLTINGKTDVLDTFLVEPYIEHSTEYYVHITTNGTDDRIIFSSAGGIAIEQSAASLHEISLSVLDELTPDTFVSLFDGVPSSDLSLLENFVLQLLSFFRTHGLSYLEINPCVTHAGAVMCLDMVAKVDDCESYRQSHHRKDIEWTAPFGTHHSQIETTVGLLDKKTGASLKLHVLNPQGRLWMILGGGGASVIVMDSLTELGLADEIANYGELSGNPEKEANQQYASIIIQEMLHSTASNKCLLIVGGISNFTHIDKLFDGIVEAIETHHKAIKQQGISILVRRGGINDQQGLSLIHQCCKNYDIPLVLMDGNNPMTDIFQHLRS